MRKKADVCLGDFDGSNESVSLSFNAGLKFWERCLEQEVVRKVLWVAVSGFGINPEANFRHNASASCRYAVVNMRKGKGAGTFNFRGGGYLELLVGCSSG